MPLFSRRTFLHGLGFTAGQSILPSSIISAFRALQPALFAETPSFADSLSFGIGRDGKLLDHASLYSVPEGSQPQNRLCFDISNNRLSCSISARGLLEDLVIELGVAPIETRSTPVGAYVEKLLQRFGPIPFTVRIGDAEPLRLDHLPQPEIYLQDNLFPRYEWHLPEAKLTMLAFVPETTGERPRVLCTVWTALPHAETADMPIVVQIAQEASKLEGRPAPVFLREDDHAWSEGVDADSVSIGLSRVDPAVVAVVLGSGPEDIRQTRERFARHTAKEWLSLTTSSHRARYGELTIPAAPFYAELYTRAAELCRQSLMLDAEGNFGGSFNGSDLPAASNVWMRDCFYASLPQSFLAPDLCATAIAFFLRWGIPSHTLGEHADNFPNANAVTNSLGNSVAGIVLAGAYYASTADRQFLRAHPEILTRSIEILNQVLASRREDVFLFPSIYVSDGESRGDFHTGSNIFLWRAFFSLARLAREVYQQPVAAEYWQDCANRLREAILANCVSTREGVSRFVEGTMQDHTQISGHDGEESDVTMACFYGFCAPDDPLYIGAAREALSEENPYLFREMEGIWWYAHGKWSSATFPGWITALASSRDEPAMLHRLERIRALTDADGSFWWWPYPHSANPRLATPVRASSKCAWAAGTFLCYFTGQVLGLQFDAPSDTLTFAPFSPWSFDWKGCRLGSGLFDCSYQLIEDKVILTVRNRTSRPLMIDLEATLPAHTEPIEPIAQGGTVQRLRQRACVRKTESVASLHQAELSIRFRLAQGAQL